MPHSKVHFINNNRRENDIKEFLLHIDDIDFDTSVKKIMNLRRRVLIERLTDVSLDTILTVNRIMLHYGMVCEVSFLSVYPQLLVGQGLIIEAL